MLVNYRPLSEVIVKKSTHSPKINILFDQLCGAQYFSKIDLNLGYHQIQLKAEDIAMTAFSTQYGLYEYTVMSFWFTNALTYFMNLMNFIFFDELDLFVVIFIDDILIYSKTLKDHAMHVQVVLQKLRDKKLYAKFSKCGFWLKEVSFLGHVLWSNGMALDSSKIKDVLAWPRPTTVKEVRGFMGLVGYYANSLRISLNQLGQ